MTSFCECSTCKEVKKKIKNPKCIYCKEHHDPRIHCIEEVKQRTNENSHFGIRRPCPACDTVHDEGRIGCPDDDTVKEILKENSEYFLDVADGKYSVYQKKKGALRALLHGEPWRILTGDNLIFNMMVELIEAKKRMQDILNDLENLDCDSNDKNWIKRVLNGEK